MNATPRSWLLTVEDTSMPDMTGMVRHDVVALMVNGPRPIPAIEVEARLNAHDRLARMAAAGEELVSVMRADFDKAMSSTRGFERAADRIDKAIAAYEEASRD